MQRKGMRWAIAATAAAAAVVAVSVVAAGASDREPRVDKVSRERAQRFLTWSLEAPAVDGAVAVPETCTRDRGDVWFLPIFTAPGKGEVSCAVPKGSRLVLNLGGTICGADDETPADQLPDLCGHTDQAQGVTLQTALVDGVEADEFAPEATDVFSVDLPEQNVLDLPAGPRAVLYFGRNLLLGRLQPGEHTIRVLFGVDPAIGEFDVDLTYHVTVG